jgi:hypothetical protein
MSNILKPVEELAAGAQQYASKAMILARVKLTVMLAETATVLIGSLWSLSLLVFFMFTTSVGLSLYFGELFGNAAVGFFCDGWDLSCSFFCCSTLLLQWHKSQNPEQDYSEINERAINEASKKYGRAAPIWCRTRS